MADAFYSVTITEPEWDDASQERAKALFEYEAGLCPCGCGNPLEVTQAKGQPFRVEQFVCRARKSIEQVKRADAAKNEHAREGWDDGLTYYAVPAEDDRPPQKRGGPRRGD